MTIKFYDFSKRPNSTKQPAANSEAISLTNVELKDECSFVNPTIRIKDKVSGIVFVPKIYNYAYIPLWTTYYYVRDWRYINGAWEVDLVMDVMATHKTEIGNTQAYIIRSAAQYNGNIIDSFYPASVVKSVSKQALTGSIYHVSLPAGAYVVGVINNASSAHNVGAVNYYALSQAQLSSLLQYLFSSNIFNNSNITEMGEGLYKSLFDPFQYIVSCMWFPQDISGFGTTTENIKVGYWDTGISGVRVTNIVKNMNIKTASPISAHPLAATRGNYLNYAPYTTLTLFLPPFGEIPIDTTFNQYMPNTYVWVKVMIDAITGQADAYISLTDGTSTDANADPGRYMAMRSAQIGVPIQLAQITSDYITAASSAGGAIANIIGLDIAGLFENIITGVKAAMPKVATSGSNGSFIEIIEEPFLVCEYASLAAENNTEYGRPLCDNRTINTLSGYIKCGEANYPFSGTDMERKVINEYMASGFFYE